MNSVYLLHRYTFTRVCLEKIELFGPCSGHKMSKFEKVHKDFDKGLNCLHFTSLKADLCQDINRGFSRIRFFCRYIVSGCNPKTKEHVSRYFETYGRFLLYDLN